MQETFESTQLQLHLLTHDDAEFMQALVNTEGWIKFIGDRNVHTLEDAHKYVQRILDMPGVFYWVVRLKVNQQPIGVVTLIKRTYLDHSDIGFAFLPEYNGQGYAREAAQQLMSTIAHDPKYQTLLATTIPENVSSIRLLEKLGLRFEREMDVEGEVLHVYSNAVK